MAWTFTRSEAAGEMGCGDLDPSVLKNVRAGSGKYWQKEMDEIGGG